MRNLRAEFKLHNFPGPHHLKLIKFLAILLRFDFLKIKPCLLERRPHTSSYFFKDSHPAHPSILAPRGA